MTITTKNLTSITITTIFAVLVSLSFGNQDAYAQSFPDFSDLTGLQLNGNAAQSGTDLRVVPAVNGQAGSAFFDTTVGIEQFNTQFEFVFSDQGGIVNGFTGEIGADGITFTVQNDANLQFSLGGGGGSLGYGGISPSVAVSFDIWPNGWGIGIENEENISILQDGDVIVFLNTVDFDFFEDQIYNAWIDYDGTTLDVFIATSNVKPGAPILSQAVDIPTVLGASDGYVGFTAGTGAGRANHDILSWNFNSSDRECNDDAGLEESICKSVLIEDESGNGIISIGEKVTYTFVIDAINNDVVTWFAVGVSDHFGGDLAVGELPGNLLIPVPHVQDDVYDSMTNLDCELTQKGKTQNEHLTCLVDDEADAPTDGIDVNGNTDLIPGEPASVGVTAVTDWNFGQSKKELKNGSGTREYTSCGVHSPNSGATISFFLAGEDPEVDDPHTLSTAAFFVDVFEFEDLSGDCDEDGISDADELNDQVNTCLDPFNPDSDNDGINDGDELSGIQNTDFGNAATDPCDDDTDDDGLLDGEETSGSENGAFGNAATDPNDEDTDDGGEIDGDETDNARNPNDSLDDVV